MARALHYVFRVSNRKATYDFYTKVLKMKVLRHEEFTEPCEAACNGPFDGQWSKTMIGYGPEDEHFVVELTYNYMVHKYKKGNDFRAILIDSSSLFEALSAGEHRKTGCGRIAVTDPDGHEFKIGRGEAGAEPKVVRVQVNVENLKTVTDYWVNLLGMELIEGKPTRNVLSYGKNQCAWELVQTEKIDRGEWYGRIAFAYPGAQLATLQEKVKAAGGKVLKELVTLPTPGKADVQVVILADPQDHEICFVGDEGFRDLSAVDPASEAVLISKMAKDDSEKWYTD